MSASATGVTPSTLASGWAPSTVTAVVIFAGTVVTATGPHAGDEEPSASRSPSTTWRRVHGALSPAADRPAPGALVARPARGWPGARSPSSPSRRRLHAVLQRRARRSSSASTCSAPRSCGSPCSSSTSRCGRSTRAPVARRDCRPNRCRHEHQPGRDRRPRRRRRRRPRPPLDRPRLERPDQPDVLRDLRVPEAVRLLVEAEHVQLGLLPGPFETTARPFSCTSSIRRWPSPAVAEQLLEHVGHVRHEVDGVVPHQDDPGAVGVGDVVDVGDVDLGRAGAHAGTGSAVGRGRPVRGRPSRGRGGAGAR